MKKIIILSCALLSFSGVASESKYLKLALEKEEQYILALMTGYEGEHEIGIRSYGKPASRMLDFYIDISKCKTRRCRSQKPEALDAAKKFGSDFNKVIGRKVINVSERDAGAIPIYLLDSPVGVTAMNAERGSEDGRWRELSIKIGIEDNVWFHSHVAHEMLNATGIQDTRQREFIGCLTYDEWRNRGVKNLKTYKGLCDIEKRAIVFADKHIRPGMDKKGISAAFSKYWVPSEFTYALAKKIKKNCSLFPDSPSCKTKEERWSTK